MQAILMQDLFDDKSDAEEEDEPAIAPLYRSEPAASSVPVPTRKRRNIWHDWTDDEYWADTDDEN